MDAFTSLLARTRPALLRSARHQLHHAEGAEDAVSDTLLAALERRPAFSDPGRVRAWLFGILRHKVVDQVRHRQASETAWAATEATCTAWVDCPDPSPRADPERRLANRQFLVALGAQLRQLPALHARAVMLRDGLGCDTQAICGELGISSVHLGVVLHRARRRLREAMVQHHHP